jgi:hypothetical protein
MKKTLAMAFALSVPLALAAQQEAGQQGAFRTVSWGIDDRPVQFKMPLETKVVSGAPYSADVAVESVQTLPDGNEIVRRTNGRIYRDSEGRVRREEQGNDSAGSAISITDHVAGYAYTLDASSRIAFRSPLGSTTPAKEFAKSSGEKLSKLKDPDEDVEYSKLGKSQSKFEEGVFGAKDVDTRTESLGPTTMGGVRVEGHRTTTIIPAGQLGNRQPITIVSEEWYSPELQVLVMTRHRDPRMGESSYTLKNIVRAEPPRTLFEVPTGYVVKDTGREHP